MLKLSGRNVYIPTFVRPKLLTGINPSNTAFRGSFYDRFFESIPNGEIKNPAKFNKLGQTLASPHWNRAAIGLAAICFQPGFDFFNKKVDRDTATVSAIRTTSKIITCTSIGFLVRGACYKLTEKYCNGTKAEGSTILTPKEILKETNTKLRNNKLKIHKNTFSTVSALAVMAFTNVLLDAPITTLVSNKLISRYKQKHQKEEIA